MEDDTVYPAHSIETPGFKPYVSKKQYDELLEKYNKIKSGN